MSMNDFTIDYVRLMSQPQQQHNVTQPQHSCWVRHENDFANPTTHPTETQQQPL